MCFLNLQAVYLLHYRYRFFGTKIAFSSSSQAELPQLCFIPATATSKNSTLFTIKAWVMQQSTCHSETTNIIGHLSAILRNGYRHNLSYGLQLWQILMSKKQEVPTRKRNFIHYSVKISFLNWWWLWNGNADYCLNVAIGEITRFLTRCSRPVPAILF